MLQPLGQGETVHAGHVGVTQGNPGAEDSRGFFELSYRRDLPGDRTLNWRTSYDEYRYRGIYRYAEEDGISDSRERDYGDWLSSEVTWRMPDFHHGHLTLGTEAKLDLRALQNAFDTGPEETPLLRVNRRDRYVGVFAQQEWTWGSHWELNAGARFDWSWLKQSAISPRLAVIYKPTGATDLKLVYGRGFRNASSYDRFWEDGITQIANPSLRPERTDAYELDIDHTVSRRLRTSASVYRYQVNDLIEQVYTEAGLAQYVNSERVRASGVSLELEWALPRAIQLSSSLELQRAVFRSTQVLPNSPGQVAKLRLKVPILGDRLTLVGGIQALGQRQTIGGVTLPWVIVPDVVVSAGKMGGGLEFSAGINNLSNGFYRDPVGLTPAVDSVIAAGRTYFVNVTWHSTETPLHARSDRLDPQKRSRETPPSREP